MRILAVADEEEKILWDYYDREKTKDVDLILSCGDLDPAYLEFLVTMTNIPVLYVRGNHDGIYEKRPPEGCTCIEDRVFDYYGLRLLGLGGSMRYRMDGENMFTEQEMRRRVARMRTKIAIKNGFDMLITHAPVKGYGDLEDLPHHGFEVFDELLYRYRPKFMLHGHVHKTYGRIETEFLHPCGTRIINVCGHKYIDIEAHEYPKSGETGSFIYDLYVSLTKKKG